MGTFTDNIYCCSLSTLISYIQQFLFVICSNLQTETVLFLLFLLHNACQTIKANFSSYFKIQILHFEKYKHIVLMDQCDLDFIFISPGRSQNLSQQTGASIFYINISHHHHLPWIFKTISRFNISIFMQIGASIYLIAGRHSYAKFSLPVNCSPIQSP